MNRFFNTISSLLKRFFTPVNLSKILVIFFVGFISRFLINDFLGVNVFTEYLTLISITFYSGFAAFIVFVHEFFSFFNISIIPSFIWNMFSKIGLIFDYLIVRPFIWIYSKTWGKNIHVLHMNDPRNSSSSIYVGSDQHHYSSVRSYNANSYYNDIAQQNPYQVEYSTVSRVPHPSHYPPSEYNYDTESYNEEYVNHNVSQSYQEDTPRFFCIDSIEEDGVDRSFHTPVNQLNAPRMSNNTTPCTMTPLFQSTEQLAQNSNQGSEASLAYSNSTTHATVGANRSEAHINWAARRYNVSRAIESSIPEPQYFQEEIRIPSPQGKLKVGIKFLDEKSNIQSLYVKYHNLAKRKFFWNVWEKGRDNYDSYEEFKRNFDPKTNIWKEIAKTTKSDISKEVRDLLKTDPFGTKRPAVNARDIRKVTYTRTQHNLNHLNSARYKATDLPRK